MFSNTDIDFNLDYSQRLAMSKTPEFRATNYVWNVNKLNNSIDNGSMMDLIGKCKPTSREEWIRYYLNFRREKYPSERFPFEALVKKFSAAAHISLNQAYNYHFFRVIDQTYNGYASEQEAMQNIWNYIQKVNPTQVSNFRIVHAPQEIDRYMRIDVEVFRLINNQWREVAGIQLKPQTYFCKTGKWARMAYSQNYHGQVEYVHVKKAPVYYWSYEQVKAGIGPMLYLDTDGNCYARQYA